MQFVDLEVYDPENGSRLSPKLCACGGYHTFLTLDGRAPFVGVHNVTQMPLIVEVQFDQMVVTTLRIPPDGTHQLSNTLIERAITLSSPTERKAGSVNFVILPDLSGLSVESGLRVFRQLLTQDELITQTHFNFMDEVSYVEFSKTGPALKAAIEFLAARGAYVTSGDDNSEQRVSEFREYVLARLKPQRRPWWQRVREWPIFNGGS